MARLATLEKILNGVRARARLSLLPAHNVQVRESQIILIQGEQDRLWGEFAWPHLRVQRLIPLQAGQREYAPPIDVTIDRIEKIEIKDGNEWVPLCPSISAANYTTYDSALDERSWPARAWQVSEQDKIEIWPIPDQNATEATQDGYLKVWGIRNLSPLVADSDRADLDDNMLELYVAGGLLAASGAKDAQLKLEAANRIYSRLKGAQVKTKSFNMFSTVNRTPVPRRPRITRYVP